MLTDFFAWWWKHLLELLPWRARVKEVDDADALLIVPVADADGHYGRMELYNRQKRQVSALGVFSADPKGIESLRPIRRMYAGQSLRLRLVGPQLLEKEIRFPVAAESNLYQVLENEMDQETPFRADEVLWNYAIEVRNWAVGWIKVRLSILPRQHLAQLLDLLSGELDLKAVEARSSSGVTRLLSLNSGGAYRTANYRLLAAAAICAVLLLANLTVPFFQQSLAIARVESEIAVIRPAADAAQALRDKITGNSAGLQAVRLAQRHLGDAIQVLAETTQVLPDSTHLVEFALADGKLSLSGRSSNPGALIPGLAKDPLFQNPSLTAPVTRIEGTEFSLFSVSAGIGAIR